MRPYAIFCQKPKQWWHVVISFIIHSLLENEHETIQHYQHKQILTSNSVNIFFSSFASDSCRNIFFIALLSDEYQLEAFSFFFFLGNLHEFWAWDNIFIFSLFNSYAQKYGEIDYNKQTSPVQGIRWKWAGKETITNLQFTNQF